MSSTSVSTRPTSRCTTRASAGRSRPASTGRRSSTTFQRAPRSPSKHAVRHPAGLRRWCVVRLRPHPGQGDALCGWFRGSATTIRYSATPTPSLPDPGKVAVENQSELLTNLGSRRRLRSSPTTRIARAWTMARSTASTCSIGPAPTRTPRPPRSALRGRRLARVRAAVRRHRQGPGGGRVSPIGAKRETAYAKVNDLRSHLTFPHDSDRRAATTTAY